MSLPEAFVAKFHPQRAPQMSGQMAAILAFLLELEPLTHSDSGRGLGHIVSLSTTSDGFLIANHGNEFIGSAQDLEENLRKWLLATKATKDERKIWQSLIDRKVSATPGCYRPTLL